MLYPMKVTAIIPDDLFAAVKKLAHGENTTDCLLIALREWVSRQELTKLSARIERRPLRFREEEIASKVRNQNRMRRC
jgi:hypothetical protein